MIQFADKIGEVSDIQCMYPKFDPDQNFELPYYEMNIDNYIQEFTHLVSISDVVVCQSVHTTKFGCFIPSCKLTHPHVPWLMECDDHPFAVEACNPSYRYTGPGSAIEQDIFDQCSDSDGIITSTDYLKDVFHSYSPETHVVPNAIDFNIWDKVKRPEKKDIIRIGWAGGSGHSKDLEIVYKPLIKILDKYPNVRVTFMHGPADYNLNHERFENFHNSWSNILEYPNSLGGLGFDIGIAPLHDSEFNRAKSNLRYLEYSAFSIPTVASNCEPFKKTILDGENGFIARTSQDWVDKLSALIENPELRVRMGHNAYDLVKTKFNLETVARNYADLLKAFVKRFRARKHSNVNVSRTSK